MSRTHRALKQRMGTRKPVPRRMTNEDWVSQQEQATMEELAEEQELLDMDSDENYADYYLGVLEEELSYD